MAYTIRIDVSTSQREQLVEVTDRVAEAVRGSGQAEGLVVVTCPHTTAGVIVNENADPDVAADVLDALRRLAPRDAGWLHREENADAHVKAVLTGSSVTLPIAEGAPVLGIWQGIFLCEFDGPRRRHLAVTCIG